MPLLGNLTFTRASDTKKSQYRIDLLNQNFALVFEPAFVYVKFSY